MKRILFTAFALLLLINSASAAKSLILSKDGVAQFAIVLPVEPTPVELTAARELKYHLDSVTGASFTIVQENEVDAAQAQLIVGHAVRLKELLPDLDIAAISYDGIVIKTVGNNLVLVGHPQRGTLYAVYTFLQDVVGVRWWTSTESFIPNRPTLEVPLLNIEYAPRLIYRTSYYLDAIRCGIFASRMRCNGHFNRIPPEYGGHHRFFRFVHSFFPLIPPSRYFADHPEWFSEIDGERRYERAQLCLTNDEMREQLTRHALEGLRQNPGVGLISISQNDWFGYCTCANCRAVDEEEGSHAGTLLRFVNQVAEDIEKEFPHILVETLAYLYTRNPPRYVRPRHNVIIRLCSIECCFVQTLADGEHNEDFRKDIQGWSEIADHLFIWCYTVNFTEFMLPHPNHRVLASNLRFFVEHNAIGMFQQGDAWCSAGDFVRMKNWVISQLMWDSSLDENELFEEFLLGYYGPVFGPKLREYLNILHDQAETSGLYLSCFMLSTNDWLDVGTWERAFFSIQVSDWLEKLEECKFYQRFRRDTLPLWLVLLKEYHSFYRQSEVVRTFFADPHELLDTFFNICHEHNVQAHREFDHPQQFEGFESAMRSRFGPQANPPEFARDFPESSWLDLQNFRFRMERMGEWTFLAEDAAASNGQAAKMSGNHREWAVQHAFDSSILYLVPREPATCDMATVSPESREYRIKIAVRCEAQEGVPGAAMTLGVYDPVDRREVFNKTLSVEEIRGSEYQWIDLGVVPLRPRHFFWFAPPGRPGEVDAVFIDRVIVVREQ